ncbi:MAG: septum site-determining protein Ssd [Nocardioides sp.]
MTTPPALLVTTDDELLGDVLRLAAAAGTTLDVAHDPGAALRGWAGAAVLLVGADQAPLMAAHRPPRHEQLHVVGHGPVPDALFRDAVALGAHHVVELPRGESWLVEVLTDALDGSGATARTVGVVAGSGGAGASTFAAALGLSAATGGPALLLDLDPWGPGLDHVAGFDDVAGVRWDALVTSSGRLGSRSLRAALPERDDLAVLTWSGPSVTDLEDAAVREVLSAAQRGSDVVVVDLPRSLAGIAGEVAGRCDEVVLVAEATVPGVASATRVAARLRDRVRSLGVVVRSTGGPVAPSAVAEALALPLLADYPSRRRVAEQVDLGLGPLGSRRSPLARAARQVLG